MRGARLHYLLCNHLVQKRWTQAAQARVAMQRKSFLGFRLISVQKLLSITSHIRAQLCKLLVYEKGAVCNVHADTEKIPGVFGTLNINLPSPHEGGGVFVTHCRIRKTSQTSETDLSFIFWCVISF